MLNVRFQMHASVCVRVLIVCVAYHYAEKIYIDVCVGAPMLQGLHGPQLFNGNVQ